MASMPIGGIPYHGHQVFPQEGLATGEGDDRIARKLLHHPLNLLQTQLLPFSASLPLPLIGAPDHTEAASEVAAMSQNKGNPKGWKGIAPSEEMLGDGCISLGQQLIKPVNGQHEPTLMKREAPGQLLNRA